MPSLKAIRTRIASVKSTQKITKAMKMIAAARLRRAQDAIVAARPYARSLQQVIADVAARSAEAHPLLEKRELKRVELIVLTSDRGMAGAFNTNVNRAVERYIVDHPEQQVTLTVVGRKGRDYLRRRKLEVPQDFAAPSSAEALARAQEVTHGAIDRYRERLTDGVLMVYNEFKSAISQTVRVEQVLPVVPKKLASSAGGEFVYEPSEKIVLDQLLPLYVEIEIYRAQLESVASEWGSRMSAMDNATKNASEMIGKYTLQYNRARQAAITKELLEIISGAESLKG